MKKRAIIVFGLCAGAFAIAACQKNNPDDSKPKALFKKAGDIDGLGVVLSLDRCQASILFSDAQVSGAQSAGAPYAKTLNLELEGGGATIRADARGFAADARGLGVKLVFGASEANFATPSDNDAWTVSGTLNKATAGSGGRVEIISDGSVAATAVLSLDSLDLVIQGCADQKN